MATGTASRPHSESALIQRSRCMECAFCSEVVFDKENLRDRIFGILPNCDHCFCLSCIRKWRRFKHSRACPVCRIESSFYVHSDYWLEDQAKVQWIQKYKDATATKPCLYYALGRGRCQMGSNCLYKHDSPKIEPWLVTAAMEDGRVGQYTPR